MKNSCAVSTLLVSLLALLPPGLGWSSDTTAVPPPHKHQEGGRADDHMTDETLVEELQNLINQGAVSIGGELLLPHPEDVRTPQVEAVTDWFNGARAAYSVIHDDVCDYQMGSVDAGWKLAVERGLSFGWSLIVGRCVRPYYQGDPQRTYWGLVDELTSASPPQEVYNHSFNHLNLLQLATCMNACAAADPQTCTEDCPSAVKDDAGALLGAPADIATAVRAVLQYELVASGDRMEQETALGIRPQFYVFPLDESNDTLCELLRDNGYLGARGGDRERRGTLNGWDPPIDLWPDPDPANGVVGIADFKVLFDAYNEDSDWFSHHTSLGVDHELESYLNEAVTQGRWAVRELHGIRRHCTDFTAGWGAVTRDLYLDHLDNLVCRRQARQVWIAPALEVIRYRRARVHCGEPALRDGVLSFPQARHPLCTRYARPLTVAIQGPADTVVEVAEGAVGIVNLPHGRVLVNVDPRRSVRLAFSARDVVPATATCATAGPGLPDSCPEPGTVCPPLGACQCDQPIREPAGGYDLTATSCERSEPPGTFGPAELSYPGSSYSTIPATDGFYTLTSLTAPAAHGQQWGIQLGLYQGIAAKTCIDASALRGIRVCARGNVRNGTIKTQYVEQGRYEFTDPTRSPLELQNTLWVYLKTHYTTDARARWSPGICNADNPAICTMPFFPLHIEADRQTCVDIAWEDFQFPYWWGGANAEYAVPWVCAPPGKIPPPTVCTPGEDADEGTEPEPLAHWHACAGMVDKLMGIIVAAVDEAGTDPVEVEDLRVSVEFLPTPITDEAAD